MSENRLTRTLESLVGKEKLSKGNENNKYALRLTTSNMIAEGLGMVSMVNYGSSYTLLHSHLTALLLDFSYAV